MARVNSYTGERDALRELINCAEKMVGVAYDADRLVWVETRDWLGAALQEYQAVLSQPAPVEYQNRRPVYTEPTADAALRVTDAMVERAARSLAGSANRPVEDWQRFKRTARWALLAAHPAQGEKPDG